MAYMAEFVVGYRVALSIGLCSRICEQFLLNYGPSVLALQFAQMLHGVASSTRTIHAAFIFLVMPPQYFHLAVGFLAVPVLFVDWNSHLTDEFHASVQLWCPGHGRYHRKLYQGQCGLSVEDLVFNIGNYCISRSILDGFVFCCSLLPQQEISFQCFKDETGEFLCMTLYSVLRSNHIE